MSDFRKELQKLGWAEGRNLRIDYRWGAFNAESRQRFAIELVAMQPDLILSQNTPTTASLRQQTRTIPIVFVGVSDPIGSGFVANFPHPGGNVTGFITMETTIASKWLGLLKEIAPRINRVAFLFNPATATFFEYYLNPLKVAAQSFGVEVVVAPAHLDRARDVLLAKFEEAPPRVVITCDDAALEFLLGHPDLFTGIPVVFGGVQDRNLAARAPRDRFTGIIEQFRIDDVVSAALRARPSTRRIIVTTATIGMARHSARNSPRSRVCSRD